jgi:hypothetical protein
VERQASTEKLGWTCPFERSEHWSVRLCGLRTNRLGSLLHKFYGSAKFVPPLAKVFYESTKFFFICFLLFLHEPFGSAKTVYPIAQVLLESVRVFLL